LSVDHEARKVDVVKLEGQAYLLSDVPFSLLEPYKCARRDHAKASAGEPANRG
jgi:hypothetical protein